MTSEPTIICPNCKTEIKLTESLAAPLVETIRRDDDERIARKDADRKILYAPRKEFWKPGQLYPTLAWTH